MTPQELKNSILQLAVQGKLVEQRAEEGTAEELYKKIQAEKQKLIAEKKIKKEKPLPEITAEEIPFDIPESWKWVRLGEVVQLNPKNSIDDEMTTSFIPMKLIDDGYRNNCSYEIKKWGDIKKGFTHFADGDIGVAKITPCFQNRKSVIFKELENGYGAGTTEVSVLRILNQTLEASYILWFLKSDYFIKNGIKSFTGTAGQQRIHKDYLSNCVFPLPPLEEQKRIVAKIEELLPQIDRYEKAWSKLEEFNKRFPDDMQKSILQYAVQGKLVEQRAEEGTAEELYKKIQAEKQKLIVEKKIKKEKPLPEITAEEIPFDIPESWKWVRLGEMCTVLTCGYASTPSYVEKENGMPFISAKNIKPYKFMPEEHNYISYELYEKLVQNAKPQKGDILLTRVGAGIGEAAIIDIDMDFAIYVSLTLIKLVNIINNEYVLYWINSPIGISSARKNVYGKNASQGNLNVKNVREFLFPLPPLEEQKRIVAKIEELLPLCDMLKK